MTPEPPFAAAPVATRFTELVGCRVPIQLAGLGGGIGTPELAAAVASAGGLGLVGHAYSADQLVAIFDSFADPAPGRLGVNFLMPFLDLALVEAAAPRVRVVDCFYGDPTTVVVERAHEGGALVSWQVGDAEEARAAVDAGCDFVIAQGTEAGGHVRGRLALSKLLEDVLSAVSVPVLAAGGITTGRAVAAALSAGADGVRVGTRFVVAEESGAHPDYVAALLAASGEDTELTTRFNLDWPGAPHRVLTSCIAAADRSDEPVTGFVARAGERTPIARWSSRPPAQGVEGDIAAMALYAGTGVGAVRTRAPAAAIVGELMTHPRAGSTRPSSESQ
jgi:nitronate monooxygenase